MSRFQSWLRSTAHKITGSTVNVKRYNTAKIPASAVFPVDRDLVSKQLREAAKRPVNKIKSLRKEISRAG